MSANSWGRGMGGGVAKAFADAFAKNARFFDVSPKHNHKKNLGGKVNQCNNCNFRTVPEGTMLYVCTFRTIPEGTM